MLAQSLKFVPVFVPMGTTATIGVSVARSRVFDTSFSPLYIVTTVFKPFEAYFFVKFYVFICTCLYLCVIIDTRGDLLCM